LSPRVEDQAEQHRETPFKKINHGSVTWILIKYFSSLEFC
jgi:hypothetical protein